MRDLAHNIDAVTAIAPAVLTATGTSEGIDLLGYESATVVIATGAIAGSGNFAAKIQHSDDGDDSPPEWDDVGASDLIGEFPTALEADSVVKVGYSPAAPRRWVRAVITKNSGTSIAATALVVRGHPLSAPVT